MRYAVIPRVALPAHLRTFTYVSNTPLDTGVVVRIPWKNKTVYGVVVGPETEENDYSVKEVMEVCEMHIPDFLVSLFLRWRSVSPGSLCARYIPAFPKRTVSNPVPIDIDSSGEKTIILPRNSDSVRVLICDTHESVAYALKRADFGNDNVYILTSETPPAEYKRLFFGILNGSVSNATIVAGKRGWWLPVRNRIVLESESPWHEESMLHPHYTVETMSTISGGHVTFAKILPKKTARIRIVHKTKSGVDIRHMREIISECLNREKSVLLYYNRLGEYRHVVCEGCGYVLTCPYGDCDMALYVHERTYACPSHGSIDMRAISNTCPVCGGIVWKKVGYGIDRLRAEMRAEFPDAHDRILCTTRKPLYDMSWDGIGACIFPNADLDLIVPRSRRETDLRWYVGHIRSLISSESEIVIYTSMPDKIAELLRVDRMHD